MFRFKDRHSIIFSVFVSFIFCLSIFNVKCVFAAEDKADKHYENGLILYERGKYKQAEEEFQKAIELTQDKKEQYYKSGLLLYKQGKFKEAEKEFQKAVNIAEEESDQHYKKGLILYDQGRYKEAEEEFQKAISTVKKEKRIEEKAQLEQQTERVQAKSETKKKSKQYLIGVGDILRISVWQNPDLRDEVMVRPDGMISFSLVGEVHAAGRSISDLQGELAEKLKEYIRYPQVSISISKLGGKRVLLLGQVRRPGIYTVTGGRTLLEAIGIAGGFTNDAVASSIVHISGGFENPVAQRLNLTKALDKGDMSENIILESDDIVFVPKKFIADVHYVLNRMLAPISRGIFDIKDLEDVRD